MKKSEFELINIWESILYIFRNSKRYFMLKIIDSLFCGTAPILTALFTAKIINCVTGADEANIRNAFIYAALIFVVAMCGVILKYIKQIKEPLMKADIELMLNKELIYKTSRVPLSFFDDDKSYDAMESASVEIASFTGVVDSVFNIASSIVSLALLFPIIYKLNFILVAVIAAFQILIAAVEFSIKNDRFNWASKIRAASRRVNGTRHMLVSKYYAEEVRVFALFGWLFKKFTNYWNELTEVRHEKNVCIGRKGLTSESLHEGLTLVLQVVLISMMFMKKILLSDFVVFNAYTTRINSSVTQAIGAITMIREKGLFLSNLFSFLKSDSEIRYVDRGCHADTQRVSIEFKDVTFSYPKTGKAVLKNVSFAIDSGKMLAIVGLNGAGKTTIVKLLLRFYEPDSGEILLNGLNINEYPIDEYYKLISVVFQSPQTYPFSLRENILFDSDADDEKIGGFKWIQEIARKCPDGIDTILLPYLDPKGIDISMGEAQRVAFARALSKETAKMLVLDEPSSSMDAEIEYELLSDIHSVCQGKTTIIISHRLSSVVDADKIIVLSESCVAEEGTHVELMKNGGIYAKLFNMQAEKYIGESDV